MMMEGKNRMSDEHGLGIYPSILLVLALPRGQRSPGTRWDHEVNGVKYTYFSKEGIPSTARDRDMIEILSTWARKINNPYVEIGSVTSTLLTYGIAPTGMNIGTVSKSIRRFSGLMMHSEQTQTMKKGSNYMGRYVEENMVVADKLQLTWGHGRLSHDYQPDLLGLSFFLFSIPFFSKHIKTMTVPHKQADYISMRSPFEKDMYLWLSRKLYTLDKQKRDSEEIDWRCLFAQFFHSPVLSGNTLKLAKRQISNTLAKIKDRYCPYVSYETTKTGIVLRKTRLIIGPDDKGAGFAPGADEDEGYEPLKVSWGADGKHKIIEP